MAQLEKELDELQSLSTYASSLSSYIYMNITGMSKIMKKFDKKFKKQKKIWKKVYQKILIRI